MADTDLASRLVCQVRLDRDERISIPHDRPNGFTSNTRLRSGFGVWRVQQPTTMAARANFDSWLRFIKEGQGYGKIPRETHRHFRRVSTATTSAQFILPPDNTSSGCSARALSTQSRSFRRTRVQISTHPSSSTAIITRAQDDRGSKSSLISSERLRSQRAREKCYPRPRERKCRGRS